MLGVRPCTPSQCPLTAHGINFCLARYFVAGKLSPTQKPPHGVAFWKCITVLELFFQNGCFLRRSVVS